MISAEPARIKLAPLGTPLRAQARAHTDGRLVLEAELPWLQLGAGCEAELADGRSVEGTVQWLGLDVTRSGTARLRILVDTSNGARSIQLSVSDANVEELLPLIKKRRRWMWPTVAAIVAGVGGWLASHAMTLQAPRLLSPPEAPVVVQRTIAPPAVVKIPAEQVQLPGGDIAVVIPPAVAPAMTLPAQTAAMAAPAAVNLQTAEKASVVENKASVVENKARPHKKPHTVARARRRP